jgi:hypothetical protein
MGNNQSSLLEKAQIEKLISEKEKLQAERIAIEKAAYENAEKSKAEKIATEITAEKIAEKLQSETRYNNVWTFGLLSGIGLLVVDQFWNGFSPVIKYRMKMHLKYGKGIRSIPDSVSKIIRGTQTP